MTPIWLRTSTRAVEIGFVVCLLLLSVMLFWESLRLGPGWGPSGPQPGFFPFTLTVLMVLGALGVLYINVYRHPIMTPFFTVSHEVEDLLKVGIPIAVAVLLIGWLGIYITAGLYLAFFMAWYGKFRWYSALAGGIILPVVLWLVLREGFNISMPMSVFYRSGTLPF
jgi:hypothetical protein